MIKINLLEETRQQVKAKAGAAGPKFQMAGNAGVIILLSGVTAAVAAMVLWGVVVITKINNLEAEIKKAEIERARLEYVIKRDEELRRKKDDLNRKIGIIADLKKKQALPVQLMDLVSRNLADFVWLEELTYTGDLVAIRGKAQTPIALANMLRLLEESEFFEEPALQRQDNNPTTGLTSFELTTTFRPGGKASKPVAAKPPPA